MKTGIENLDVKETTEDESVSDLDDRKWKLVGEEGFVITELLAYAALFVGLMVAAERVFNGLVTDTYNAVKGEMGV